MIRPPYDGWVDCRAARAAAEGELVPSGSEDHARSGLAQFRGEVLAAAYALESELETLILWHLFRDRQDGMAAFFEDLFLRENGFGLERKIRVVHAIIDYWSDDEQQARADKLRLDAARQIRNQVAHWPARLVPVQRDGATIGFDVELVKGERVVPLDESARRQLIEGFEHAKRRLELLSAELADFARRGESD